MEHATNGSSNGIALTPEGFERLRLERDALVHAKLPEALERLAQASGLDDPSAEAAECLIARSEVELLRERIAVLEARLESAHVLPAEKGREGRAVRLGARVRIEDLDEASVEEYVLVSSAESDPIAGRVSNESPVGRALEGRRPGETVEVHTPHGLRHLRIVAVTKREEP